MKYFVILIIFTACTVGTEYHGAGEGDYCGIRQACADGLKCVNHICVREITDAGSDIIDADITDITDASDGDVSDVADADGSVQCDPDMTQCGEECCTAQQLCLDETCIDTQGNCTGDEQCPGDTWCHEGLCIPYGTGPRGSINPFCGFYSAAGLFQPVVQCEWLGPPAGDPYPNHVNVLSTPLVADFNFNNDSSVRNPSIVFVSYDGLDGSSGYSGGAFGVIRVLDGRTCEQLYNVGTHLNGCNTPAIADLNGDGRPEIVAHNGLGGVEAFTYDATGDSFVNLWHGHDSMGNNITFGAQSTGWSSISIHDINNDNHPEIISYGMVYDHTGLMISNNLNLSSGIRYPAVADIDRDGAVEITNGTTLYSYDSNANQWIADWSTGPMTGFIAYADFGTYPEDPSQDDRKIKDGFAEIVIVGGGRVYIVNRFGRVIFGPVFFPAGSGGGPPTAGDFDGDGRVEFSAASSDSISVFDPDCTGIPDIDTCVNLRTDGILWHQVSQDHSSNSTGSSLFDFEGDNRVEVIYADEVFTRVYDGRTGEVLFSQYHSSCTWNENPIVADVDGDFNAELVVPSNLNCNISPTSAGGVSYPLSHQGYYMDPLYRGLRCEVNEDCLSETCDNHFCRCTDDTQCGGASSGYVCDVPVPGTPGTGNVCRSQWLGEYGGIKVYADTLDRWVGSRTIWNQHNYTVSNISESGVVPSQQTWMPNWMDSALNNYRQNVQGEVGAGTAPDLTVQAVDFDCGGSTEAVFTVTVCNRGTQPLPAGIPITFYDAAAPVCQVATDIVIETGTCEDLTCSWPTAPQGISNAVVITVNADDNGDGTQTSTECNENNNQGVIPDVYCNIVGK